MIEYAIKYAAMTYMNKKFTKGDIMEFTMKAPSDQILLEGVDKAVTSLKGWSYEGTDHGLLVFHKKMTLTTYASNYWLAIQAAGDGEYSCAMAGRMQRYQVGSKSKLKKNCQEFKSAWTRALQ